MKLYVNMLFVFLLGFSLNSFGEAQDGTPQPESQASAQQDTVMTQLENVDQLLVQLLGAYQYLEDSIASSELPEEDKPGVLAQLQKQKKQLVKSEGFLDLIDSTIKEVPAGEFISGLIIPFHIDLATPKIKSLLGIGFGVHGKIHGGIASMRVLDKVRGKTTNKYSFVIGGGGGLTVNAKRGSTTFMFPTTIKLITVRDHLNPPKSFADLSGAYIGAGVQASLSIFGFTMLNHFKTDGSISILTVGPTLGSDKRLITGKAEGAFYKFGRARESRTEALKSIGEAISGLLE